MATATRKVQNVHNAGVNLCGSNCRIRILVWTQVKIAIKKSTSFFHCQNQWNHFLQLGGRIFTKKPSKWSVRWVISLGGIKSSLVHVSVSCPYQSAKPGYAFLSAICIITVVTYPLLWQIIDSLWDFFFSFCWAGHLSNCELFSVQGPKLPATFTCLSTVGWPVLRNNMNLALQ